MIGLQPNVDALQQRAVVVREALLLKQRQLGQWVEADEGCGHVLGRVSLSQFIYGCHFRFFSRSKMHAETAAASQNN